MGGKWLTNSTGLANGFTLYCRDYPEAKLQENLDAEIFGVLAEEARDAFDEGMVVELKSETAEDIDSNCERILEWMKTWREGHGSQHNKET
jgi:adenylate kinase